ncbi:ciliogenesis and planar polarity effector 1-like [Polypterus senegalus]|uniref:ciliogenesis and planar polarity effector 1-like n=1 Tax=Polypterus senegalus TaxID=55291 RepID=UPI00196590B6|nr:ciliogenesis and planar polarity effector 1-like [Polypterus senegalus]
MIGLLPQSLSQSVIHEHVATKLSEMDIQLTALQNIAKDMELEFSNTRLLVNKIEMFGAVINPEMKTENESELRILPEQEASVCLSPASELTDLMEEAGKHLLPESTFAPVIPAVPERGPPSINEIISSAQYLDEISDPVFQITQSSSAKEGLSDNLVHHRTGTDPQMFTTETEMSTETLDALHLTGLSDVADILGDLLTESGVAARELGLSEAQACKLMSMHENQTSQPCHTVSRTEQERREIREWMRRKRRERQAEYCKEREKQKEQEDHPSMVAAKRNVTSKETTSNKKMKEGGNRMDLSKHHIKRKREAINLMNEILSDTVQLTARPLLSPKDASVKSKPTMAKGRLSVSCNQSLHPARQGTSRLSQTRSTTTSPGRVTQISGSSTRILPRKAEDKGRPSRTHTPVAEDRSAQLNHRDTMPRQRSRRQGR